MKVDQLVASVQRLQMVKNRSKLKASMNHKNEELKALWLNLSKEASELLEKYNNTYMCEYYDVIELYNKEWQLYLKMKLLNNKYGSSMDNIDEKFKVIEGIKMSEINYDKGDINEERL
jgi:hypothetical protein